ncbi:MAG: 1-deoxy-D-xylulose-5-phosphate synthase [Candidatus Cloacimonadota bacterium]|nr:1-deoxy-D-xylulose-5-phosphate synthase [Candidatus Cloacimonadota bacterium]
MLLDKVKSPQDVKKLNIEHLTHLAKEVRQRIIEVTAKNGGHIAPSLGATDLSIALLKIFDPLKERIVWDVGHQSYAFKILTERNNNFDTLRQFGGISGFNNIHESKYDAYSVGHSSTSISAAVGIIEAKNKLKKFDKTIAIIGDGALTGGISFEGLNHAGHLQNKDLIVILNDNKMSISPNVGALQNYLTNLLTSKYYNKIKKQIWDVSASLPKNVRRKFIYGVQKLEESVINILVPNIIFEDLGFKYVGPVDGHDMTRLVQIFDKIKNNMVGPIFVHVVTQKGKGYKYAEKNQSKFHGLGPFKKSTGEAQSSSKPSYSKIFGSKLVDLAKKDEKVIAISAAMVDGTGLADFRKEFPDRLYDVGIAEQHAVTFAGGLAVGGLKPFVAIYSTFLQRAYDQIIQDISLQNLPVVFCLDRAGLVGEDGATHHGVFDLSYMKAIPNLTIAIPANAQELEMMLEMAKDFPTPFVIRYPRGQAVIKENVKEIEIGKSIIEEEGKDIVIIGAGKGFDDAEKVTEILKKNDIHPTLVNIRFLKPLDTELLKSLQHNHKYVVTIEDNTIVGGLGSSIKDFYCNSDLKVYSYGIPDHFVNHGDTELLRKSLKLHPEQIAKDITNTVKLK